jgi:hypothetical protein
MGLANGNFAQPGDAPGEAAGWTLVSRCQAERWVAFDADSSATAVEGFERWARVARAFAEGDLALAFFAPRADGHEGFERGWDNDIYLTELLPAQAVVAGFGDDVVERFNWVVRLGAWTDVVATAAIFHGAASDVESFELGWLSQVFARTWLQVGSVTASFGNSAVEAFNGTWPHAGTI